MLEEDANLVECVDPRFLGITEELGITTTYAVPYAPWSKGTTERWFGTFEGRCGKTFVTYCGNITSNHLEAADDLAMGHEDAKKVAEAVAESSGMKRVI